MTRVLFFKCQRRPLLAGDVARTRPSLHRSFFFLFVPSPFRLFARRDRADHFQELSRPCSSTFPPIPWKSLWGYAAPQLGLKPFFLRGSAYERKLETIELIYVTSVPRLQKLVFRLYLIETGHPAYEGGN